MNPNPKDAWYHCGHCGSLFQSDYGFDEERVCEICKRKPGVGLWPAVNSISPVASAKVASFHKKGERVRKLARTPSSRMRRSKKLLIFVLVWMIILLGVVGLRFILTKEPSKPRILTVADLSRNLTEKEKRKILERALPECEKTLFRFLADAPADERMRLIFRSAELEPVVAAYEKNHPYLEMDVNALQRTESEWLKIGEEWMILTRWKDSRGGNEFDAVFRSEQDAWKLDWQHFSQYSQVSWQSFVAGEDKFDSAEFRLLAKIQQDGEPPRLKDQRMMMVLAAPVWGKPTEALHESEPITIDLMSDEGKLLKTAFGKRSQNLAVSGGELPPLTPDGFISVHVRVTRDEIDNEIRLTLNELKACHWLD